MRTLLSRPVLGWALYDFANTIFSYAVITRYFNDYVIEQRGAPDIVVGAMGLLVSLALIFTMPVFGILADRHGARKPFLAGFTALCVTTTAMIGIISWLPAVFIFGALALFAFNSALAHYDPLLDTVAEPEQRSLVSGFGVALGYVGVMVALIALGKIVGADKADAFLPTAIMFAVASLPCFLWVREKRRPTTTGPSASLTSGPAMFAEGIRAARRDGYGRFLLARFLYVDAIATVIAFMAVYAQRVGQFTDSDVDKLLAISIGTAMVGALTAGTLIRWFGELAVLQGVLIVAVVALVAGALSPGPAILWMLGPAVGAVLGAINTCDRLIMLKLAPADRRGEAFGIYALVGKVSSGVGPFLLWGGTIWLLSDALDITGEAPATRVAVITLACAAVAGLLVLRKVQLPNEQSVN